jgi:hypothetical protein
VHINWSSIGDSDALPERVFVIAIHADIREIDGLETFSNRRAAQQALADWCAQGRLDAADLSTAWAPTLPDRMDWRRWLDRALLILGTALPCA